MNDTNQMKDQSERVFEERCCYNIVLVVIGLTLLLFFAICICRDDFYLLMPLSYYDEFRGSVKDILTGYVLPIVGIFCVVGGLCGVNNSVEKHVKIEGVLPTGYMSCVDGSETDVSYIILEDYPLSIK